MTGRRRFARDAGGIHGAQVLRFRRRSGRRGRGGGVVFRERGAFGAGDVTLTPGAAGRRAGVAQAMSTDAASTFMNDPENRGMNGDVDRRRRGRERTARARRGRLRGGRRGGWARRDETSARGSANGSKTPVSASERTPVRRSPRLPPCSPHRARRRTRIRRRREGRR